MVNDFEKVKLLQKRAGLTNQQMAGLLGICRNSYMRKIKTGLFYYTEICGLMKIFNCTFEELFDSQ